MKVPVLAFLAAKFAIPGIILNYIHTMKFGFSISNTLLLWFLVINLWICVWELTLFYCWPQLKADYEERKKLGFYDYDNKDLKLIRAKVPWTLAQSEEISKLCTFSYWTNIWLEYGRFDDAYVANPETFQYNIDVMNGHSTPIPCLIILISMFTPIFSPVITGIIGALAFYQKWYGTLVYLFVFHNCNKGKHISNIEWISAVLGSNGVWFTIPLLGLYQSIQMILTQSFSPIQ
eukprot:UN02264